MISSVNKSTSFLAPCFSPVFFNYYVLTFSLVIHLTWLACVVHGIPSPSGVEVEGYQELEEPFYPFQQYIQVRKTYTVEHVPVYEQEQESPSYNLHTSASSPNSANSNNEHDASSTSHSDDSDSGSSHYHVPRLREELKDYKKHEVYEEKGYGDSAYDHEAYGGKGQYKGDEPSNHYENDHEGAGSSKSELPSSEATTKSQTTSHPRSRRRPIGPPVPSLHSTDGTSTKILEYAAANMYDKDAHEKGIYAARDNIYCPEVIDFDLSSKSMGMGKGGRGAKPRLRGLGAKITCLKNKYFGREPLPRAIFPEPSEAKHSVIEVPTFEHFHKMIRSNVNSMSSFHNF